MWPRICCSKKATDYICHMFTESEDDGKKARSDEVDSLFDLVYIMAVSDYLYRLSVFQMENRRPQKSFAVVTLSTTVSVYLSMNGKW